MAIIQHLAAPWSTILPHGIKLQTRSRFISTNNPHDWDDSPAGSFQQVSDRREFLKAAAAIPAALAAAGVCGPDASRRGEACRGRENAADFARQVFDFAADRRVPQYRRRLAHVAFPWTRRCTTTTRRSGPSRRSSAAKRSASTCGKGTNAARSWASTSGFARRAGRCTCWDSRTGKRTCGRSPRSRA